MNELAPYLVILQIITTVLISAVLWRSQKREKRDEKIDKMFEDIFAQLAKTMTEEECSRHEGRCFGSIQMILKPLEDRIGRVESDLNNHCHTNDGSVITKKR